MSLDFSKRSDEEEIMDDFELGGEDFQDGLDQIANINYWLGGNRITVKSIDQIFRKTKDKLVILDAGCGNGDMCRQVVKLARKRNRAVSVIGVDANPGTIKYAKKLSTSFPEIEYLALDIFSDEFEKLEFDVLLATLTLHHFDDRTIQDWISNLCKEKIRIIINDLHRSKLAYRLFQLISVVFNLNQMNRIDGLISIKRGFKPRDFKKYNQLIKNNNADLKISLKWKWAFRYLWIIENV